MVDPDRKKILLFLFISFLTTENGFYLFSDLFQNKHLAYDFEMISREKQLLEYQVIYKFNRLKNSSKILFVYDVNPKLDSSINRSYKIYFKRENSEVVGI